MDKETYDLIQTGTAIATSFGTVGAVALSLFYSRKDRRVKLDVVADLVYVSFDEHGKPGKYVISFESAEKEIIASMFHKYKVMLRVGALNSGSTSIYINGFYFYTIAGGNTNLFLDSSKALDGASIGSEIHPGQMFSMYFPVSVLRGKHILARYTSTRIPRIRFRIAVETSLGHKFHNSIPNNVHLAILSEPFNKSLTDDK